MRDMVDSLRNQTNREELPEYQQFAALSGRPTWVSKAARDYDIPNPTISRWARAGHIKIIGKSKNRVLLDEQDVAFCAHIHKQHGTAGRSTFTDTGTPNL